MSAVEKPTPGMCPGCGHVTEEGLPPGWNKAWWCRVCLQKKCSDAWRSTQTFKQLSDGKGSNA